MGKRIRGDTARVLEGLTRREVRNAADVAAVRGDLGALRKAGLSEAAILEAIGGHAERLRLVMADAGRLAVRGIDELPARQTPSAGPVTVARQFGRRLRERVGALNVHGPSAEAWTKTHGAVKGQSRQSALSAQWRQADLMSRARLMQRVPAITRGELSGLEHQGAYESFEQYKYAERAAKVVEMWQAPASREALLPAVSDELPSPTATFKQDGFGAEIVSYIHTRETLSRGSEDLMLRTADGDRLARRTAQLLCERLLVVDTDLAEVLGEECQPETGILAGDALEMVWEYVDDKDPSLAPAATVLAGEQQLYFNH